MSTAISVYHGEFGRAALYHLDRPMTKHVHREGHLIFYIGSATALLNVNGRNHRCDPRYAVAVNPWEVHTFVPAGGRTGTICLVLYIKPDWFTRYGSSSAEMLRFGQPEVRIDDRIEQLVDLVALRLERLSTDPEFDHYLFTLTDACYRNSHRHCDDDMLRQPCEPARFNDFRIRRSLRIMADNVNSSPDMDQIARESGLSRPHFFKLFRRQTGLTPHLYFNTLRMEKAIGMLTVTDKSVTDIGLDLGFSSQSSFTRFFCLNAGMAPTDYRRVSLVGAA